MRSWLAVVCLLLAPLAPLGAAAASSAGLPATEVRARVRLDGPAPRVFESLGELYGVRVTVDGDFPRRSLRLRLDAVDFADALRAATTLAQAFWVVTPEGGVVVAEDTSEKRESYMPQQLKTFPLSGYTAEELNEAARLLRELLDMRRIRIDVRSGTLSVLDTPYRLAVAEQLLAQLPYDPGEVLVEALLLEVSRQRALELGLVSPDNAFIVNVGAGVLLSGDGESLPDIIGDLVERGLLPGALSDAALQSLIPGGAIDPSQLAGLLPALIFFGGGRTTYAAHLPSLELKLLQLTSVTRAWQRLTLRAGVGQEATAFIGTRFPVIFSTFSSSFLPAITQELIRRGELSPPVPAFRYEELGLKLTVTPQVHPQREITLAMKLEQMALTGQVINDIPVLSNRVVEDQVRLRSGESLLIAGLRRESQAKGTTSIPGLGALPLIGPLFSRLEPDTQTTELILLITPRFTRLPAKERLLTRTLYVGTEKDFAPVGPAPLAAPRAPQPPQPPPTRPPGQPPTPQQPPQTPPAQPPQQQQPPPQQQQQPPQN